MNVQDYISSGIVESYVLGLATAEERSEFERMCSQHPEVLNARTDFELSLEQQAMQNAVTPPPELKQRILQAVLKDDGSVKASDQQAPVIKTNWLRYAVAASLILLAGSLFWNMSQYSRNKKLQASYNELTRDYDSNAVRLAEIEDQVAMLTLNPSTKLAALKGLAPAPASHATVVWDTLSKDVYLIINNLPQPATGHQYQLWALFNGQPIDVGMIDNEVFTGEKKLMIQMKNVTGAQAFAITLEKKGGSPTPQGAMYVMGNL
ncbi:MAG: anti-sigma factor [Chitinophagaceae bacterium]|nr:MAG: anti-sigma factor [Chitinophagaceae bacterium]